MSDTNLDLTLLWRAVQQAARDAESGLAALERLNGYLPPRLTAIEARLGSLEQRGAGLEAAIEQIAQSNVRIERTLAEILEGLRQPPAT